MSWITTGTGATKFDFANPSARDVSPYDIVASLSRTARFRGMGMHYFSVAQHSVLVAYLMLINSGRVTFEELLNGKHVFERGDWGHRLVQIALLHDAPETYVADLATPLKRLLPGYKAIELRIEPLVYSRFGVEDITDKELELLYLSDVQASLMERDLLFPDNLKNWDTERHHPGYQVGQFFDRAWPPAEAHHTFSMFFAQYFPEVTGHVH